MDAWVNPALAHYHELLADLSSVWFLFMPMPTAPFPIKSRNWRARLVYYLAIEITRPDGGTTAPLTQGFFRNILQPIGCIA
jgi:hypothetical protein